MSNYGDALYPKAIAELLKQEGFGGIIEHYALLPGKTLDGAEVRPLTVLKPDSMDAVLVGGGDLIRCDLNTVALDHLNVPTELRNSMLNRIRARCFRYRSMLRGPGAWLPIEGWSELVPVAYVSVGVHRLAASESASRAIENIDAAWVRTEAGAKHLEDAGMPQEKLEIGPDAVFAMSELKDPAYLASIGKSILVEQANTSKKPVLFQAAAFHGWNLDRITKMLAEISNYPIVVLALGAYAGEDRLLKAAALKAGVPFLTGLPANEVTAVLAAAGCIITTSMHAAIVGSCLGVPTIVPGVDKTTSALSVCPDPPAIHLVDDKDISRTVSNVYGQEMPAPTGANADAAIRAFRHTMKKAGIN